MTNVPPDPPPPPQPPNLNRKSVDALIEYARAQSDYSQWWVDFGRSRGQEPDSQQIQNVDGWAFVALALLESYDD